MTDFMRLPTFGQDAGSDVFHVVVESPRGSAVKLKYDPALQAFSISRPLALGITYPFDWGFVPSTAAPDGDPIDAALLWDVATFPGIVVPCRACALIKVEQRGADGKGRVRNDRVLAIPVSARRQADIASAGSLAPRVRAEIEHFFMAATALEGKDAKILGWDSAESALDLLRSSANSL